MVAMAISDIRENDVELAKAVERCNDALIDRDSLMRRIHFQQGDLRLSLSDEDALCRATETQLARLAHLDTEIAHWESVIRYSDRRWAAHGRWSRYYKVRSNHIHSTRECIKIGEHTRLIMLAEFSGRPTEDVVAAHGPRLCRSCFPGVPVEWTMYGRRPTTQCPGTGTWMPWRYDGDYEVCPVCGRKVRCTSAGKLRKHAPPVEEIARIAERSVV
ncbi:hypothetical protein J4U01_gp096 [Mycobacterium phage Kumao]|uniref:Uncharacterized protein n=1 Tax=Mycobacterium phage Kumao TaxID=2041344 RepID=A0A2D1GPU7_9CAUD|nr:hypothetical protein J4U01_gp096 [Mycobacterium phage Kumao]ATN94062.1 hypothetical protein SEA_KUMAO_100 [Mycobacterium phage Kumao]